MLAAVTVAAEAIKPCISLRERKMKKSISAPTKLVSSECLALAVLEYSLQRLLYSSHIVFTQLDVSGEDKAIDRPRKMELRIVHIVASFADMSTPRKLRPTVDAYVTLEKQKSPLKLWRPVQVGMTVDGCDLKYNALLLSLDGPLEGTPEAAIRKFAENLNHEAYRDFNLKPNKS
jgi:hypothetical protein